MSAYGMAHIRTIDFNEEVVEYLRRIDATLPDYEGRFIVHGQIPEVLDGTFEGVIVVIEFPDVERARAWYESEPYAAIAPYRINNSDGGAFVVDGVDEDYRAESYIAKALGQPAS
jgi:uncharacterized protein (DUF1330 family)